jgi:hypothetical protein
MQCHLPDTGGAHLLADYNPNGSALIALLGKCITPE